MDGGVLRDLAVDSRAGLFDPAWANDVDLAFFDADDVRPTAVDDGVHDLLDGICRRTPRRVTYDE